jgi:hypothetical protein
LSGVGGWTWKQEYLEGRKIATNAQHKEAWIYHTDCDCQPFKDIPGYYRERIKLGKEAKGIVIKLGLNSIYGKLAQSTGIAPPYQSWIWAGNITSGTRAQLLDALSRCVDGWSCLMLATDGIYSRERLSFGPPRRTGTDDLKTPLGGWEEKIHEKGIFAVRPGIYFPNESTEEDLKEVRARGLGKKVLYDKWLEIVATWLEGKEKVTLGNVTRFVGAKTGMSYGPQSGVKRSENYGEWIPYPITVRFRPTPKRQAVMPDGRLQPWEHFNWQSIPYKRALKDVSPEAMAYAMAREIADEQPSGEYGDMS